MVQLQRDGMILTSVQVEQTEWMLPQTAVAGDVLQVREIGLDRRLGWPAQLVI